MLENWNNIYKAAKVKSEEYNKEDQIGLLGTSGADFKTFEEIYMKTPKKIWTIVKNEDGEMKVLPGIHIVNRVMHLISTNEWNSADEEYLYI